MDSDDEYVPCSSSDDDSYEYPTFFAWYVPNKITSL
jgi:hypothetical protein